MTATRPISMPFNARSTAAEVVDGIDLTGRRVIVTGGASGIGIETARALAGAGAEVTLAVRNLAAGERITRDIITTGRNEHVLAAPLDLADQASVASFTAAWDGPLRGHPFPAARLRAVGRVRAVQDGQRPVSGRGDEALGERRDHRQRTDARRDPDRPAEVHHRRRDPAGCALRPAAAARRGRLLSRALQRPCWSRRRRCLTASAGATSRTATRRS